MKSARSMAACLAVLLAALPLVAGAEVAPPAIKSSSVDGGWTNKPGEIAVRYTKMVRADRTRADLFDVDGLPVFGTGRVDINTITFTPDVPLTAVKGPFTLELRTVGYYEPATTAQHLETLVFNVDVSPPARPQLDPGLVPQLASTDGDPFRARGRARDLGAAVSSTSGVEQLRAHFFDTNGNEHGDLATTTTISCGTACPVESAFEIGGDHLPTGYWTMRVSSIDRAGNRSAPSDSVSFLVVR